MGRVIVIPRCLIPCFCLLHLTSTPRAVYRRQLNESGIERALVLTVSTIIESVDTGFSNAERSHSRWGGVRTQGQKHALHHLIQSVIFW